MVVGDCKKIWEKMRDPENRDVRMTHDGKYIYSNRRLAVD